MARHASFCLIMGGPHCPQKRHLDQFSRFYRAHPCKQHINTESQGKRRNSPPLALFAVQAMRPKTLRVRLTGGGIKIDAERRTNLPVLWRVVSLLAPSSIGSSVGPEGPRVSSSSLFATSSCHRQFQRHFREKGNTPFFLS